VLQLLVDQPEPTRLAALARASGLHPNTLREHLDTLLADGWVRRIRTEPSGRGRPAWLYEAVDDGGADEYAGLATALAATIVRTSPAPADAAREAGELWGRDLTRRRDTAPAGPEEARDEVVALLDDLGFAPDPVAERRDLLRLTRCPLLEAAHRHPEVVCGVHLGIVRGALASYDVDPAGAQLQPFAEPGACLLTVPPLADDGSCA
jgi:predicted ArsR family transcriptional regulator